jgi:hypothetical protein
VRSSRRRYPRDELLGQSVQLLFPNGFTQAHRELRKRSRSAPDGRSVRAATTITADRGCRRGILGVDRAGVGVNAGDIRFD